jgi:hypothetical protein
LNEIFRNKITFDTPGPEFEVAAAVQTTKIFKGRVAEINMTTCCLDLLILHAYRYTQKNFKECSLIFRTPRRFFFLISQFVRAWPALLLAKCEKVVFVSIIWQTLRFTLRGTVCTLYKYL